MKITNQRISDKTILVLLIVITLATTFFLITRNPHMEVESPRYLLSIHNLVDNKGYTYGRNLELLNPPGYGIIAYLFFLVARDIELSGMITSAISTILIIPLTFYTSRFLFGRRTALISSFLVTFSPVVWANSYTANPTALFTFFLLLSFFVYVQVLSKKSRVYQSRPSIML